MNTLAKLLLLLVLTASSSVSFAMTAQNPSIVRGPVQSNANAPIIERIWFVHTGKNGSSQTIDAQGNVVEEGATYGVDVWVDARLPNGELPKMGEITVKRSGLLPQDPSSKNFVSRLSVPDFQFPYTESATLKAVYDGYETTVSYSIVIEAPLGVTVKSSASSAATVTNGTTCEPYQCSDGTRVDRCSADGTVINYFAAPCHDHGGEWEEWEEYPSFSDVSRYHTNSDAVEYVLSKGIVSGYPDGTYRPDQTINRAEFTKIVVESLSEVEYASCQDRYFSDVRVQDWFFAFVCTARQSGIISGYSDGTFRPAASINFVEAAKIIAIAYDADLARVPPLSGHPWYEYHVWNLSYAHAIPTTITSPDHMITRGEMAEIIYRLKARVRNKLSMTAPQLLPPSPSPSVMLNAPDGAGCYSNDDCANDCLMMQEERDTGGFIFGVCKENSIEVCAPSLPFKTMNIEDLKEWTGGCA